MIIYIIDALGILAGIFVLFRAFRSENKNEGLIGITFSIILCCICCSNILIFKRLVFVKWWFTIYYIAFAAMLLFCVPYTEQMRNKEKVKLFRNPVLYLSLIQSGVMLYNVFTNEVFNVERHILLGNNWWVLSPRNTGNRVWFWVFVVCNLASICYIIYGFLAILRKSAKIYWVRSYVLIGIQTVFFALEAFCFIKRQPLWIPTMAMPVVCVALSYFALYHAKSKLTRTSLFSFADNLSEGFILYDERNVLIYVNGRLKQLLDEETLRSFRDKSVFISWKEDTQNVEGIFSKKIMVGEDAHYFLIHEQQLEDQYAKYGTFYSLEDATDTIMKIQAMNEVNEELERSAKMKSDFLANMSHEIRTPMNAVIGMAEMALREQLTAQATEYILQIKRSGHNLLNIINDILDFSKIESGKMDIIPEDYEPASEYQDIVNTLMTRVGEKDIVLIANVDPMIPYKLNGDAMRIRQILINLANNAIKFTKKGQVCISVDYKRQDETTALLSFHVVDTGMGIKEEDLRKLFVSFQQVDSKRNRSIEGTGLGLAISKRLVEAMGGSIGVQSEYGVGSDFYFEIPQTIVDDTPSMIAENASTLIVGTVFKKPELKKNFMYNMERLGVQALSFDTAEEVSEWLRVDCGNRPGMQYLVFYEKEAVSEEIESLFEQYRDLKGVAVVGFDSAYTSHMDNLRVLRQPLTTLGLTLILNDKVMTREGKEDDFDFRFTAPDARVLIVDDNNINLTVAEGLLRPLEMTIDIADSGKKAIAMIADHRYDIIFMDHMMPEMDGVETTAFIRENIPAAADVPIIALTANAISGAKEMFLSKGMNDFVSKPIEVKAIVAKVKQWLPDRKICKLTGIAEEPEITAEENLPLIPELDVSSAVGMIGSVELYNRVAGDYLKNAEGYYAEIEKCFADMDVEQYTIRVHALKSSSRQIGAQKLAGLAEQLENAGHANDVERIKADTAEMLAEYRHVQELLKPFYGAVLQNNTEKKEFDTDVLKARLEDLKNGCEELDMDIMEEIGGELRGYLFTEEQQSIVDRLCDAIDSVDVDTCQELADELNGLL